MHKVIMYRTCDGAMHRSMLEAHNYLEGLCQTQIDKIAHKLVHANKWSAMCKILEEHIAHFEDIIRWKNDMQLFEEDDT